MVEEPPAYAVPPAPVLEPAPVSPHRRRAALAVLGVGLLAVLVLVAALFATGRLGPPAKPLPRVALVDPEGALAIVDGQGSSRVVHAPADTSFTFPAWSPDGTRVAAVASTPGSAAVELFQGAGDARANPVVLYESADQAPFYLYWTPDGRAVTFLTVEGDSIALRSVPADGSASATVLRQGAPMYWAWESPERMLVHTGDDADAFLGQVGLDGKTVTTVDGAPGRFRAPAASADGRYEAYAVGRPDGTEALVVAAADGSSRHEIPVFGPSAFAFGPSGSSLAFIGPTADDRPAPLPLATLRLVDAATGDVRALPVDEAIAFFWSPDGSRIAALGVPPAGPSDAATARLASTLPGAGRDQVGVDAPGIDVGLAFVDVATGTATPEQVVSLSPLFINQVLPYFDQYALSHRVWAPDGGSILLPVVDDDGTDVLQVLPADGSPGRVLAPGSMGFWSP
jgi:TolB protein